MGSMISEGGDGHGILMMEPNNISTPALAVSFAQTNGGSHVLAVSDEEGFVSLFNTQRRLPSYSSCQLDTEDVRTELWRAHNNAIFDICWIRDDTRILTASGDQTIRLWDVQAKECLGVMKGHTGSVKSLCSHPLQSDLFVSGSRDGSIAFWDMRSDPASCNRTNEECFTTVATIKDAHVPSHGRRMRRNKVASKSITSVLYHKDERVVISAGAADSVVKFWDTRKLKAPITQTPPQCQTSVEGKEGRVHGIASLSLDSSGEFLISSCMDNKIYLYNAFQPDKGHLKSFAGHVLGSFYIKASFSPDGTHILSGSSDENVFIWQVDRPEADPVILKGHRGEVTAVDWCPTDFCKIATCSDDYTVRVWSIKDCTFESEHCTPSAVRRRISAYPSSVSQRLFDSTDAGHLETSPSDIRACDTEVASADSDKAFSPNGKALTPKASKKLIPGTMSSESSPHASSVSKTISHSGENYALIQKTPESMKSPSSVLNPPSSSKRKTILDYFGTS